MAIRKNSKISDVIMLKYLFACPACQEVYVSSKEIKKKKCPKCGEMMVLSGTTTE